MKTAVLAMALGAAFSTSAYAQMTEYYVVRDTQAKKCMIVDKKPATSTTITVAGDGTVYKTRTEAESAMKKIQVCM